jgi:hypothetical protein
MEDLRPWHLRPNGPELFHLFSNGNFRLQSLHAGGPIKSVDALGIVVHGNGAAMAERDHIGIDTFGDVAQPLDLGRSFFQNRCHYRSDGCFGGDTQMGHNHIGSIFGHGFSFIEGKGITR